MASKFELNDTTPAAPAGRINVKWQLDVNGNVSAHVADSAAAITKFTKSTYYPAGGATSGGQTQGTGWSVPNTGGPVMTAAGTTYREAYFSFATGADSTAFLVVRVEAEWDGSAMNLDLAWFVGTAASTNVRWSVDYSVCAPGTAANPTTEPTWTALGFITTNSSGATFLTMTRFSFTPTGGAGNNIRLRIKRIGTADTAGAAGLFGAALEYRRNL